MRPICPPYRVKVWRHKLWRSHSFIFSTQPESLYLRRKNLRRDLYDLECLLHYGANGPKSNKKFLWWLYFIQRHQWELEITAEGNDTCLLQGKTSRDSKTCCNYRQTFNKENERSLGAHIRYHGRDFENGLRSHFILQYGRRQQHMGDWLLGKWEVYQKRRCLCLPPHHRTIYGARCLASYPNVPKFASRKHIAVWTGERKECRFLSWGHPHIGNKETCLTHHQR